MAAAGAVGKVVGEIEKGWVTVFDGVSIEAISNKIIPPKATAADKGVGFAEFDQLYHKIMMFQHGVQPRPVEPAVGIVLIIGVVIAELGMQKFVTRNKHGGAVA